MILLSSSNQFFPGLLVLAVFNLVEAQRNYRLADCQRIYLESEAPITHLLNAVYVKTNITRAGFPVYKDERGDFYFRAYDSINKNKKIFQISTVLDGDYDDRSSGLEITESNDPGVFALYDTQTKKTWRVYAKCVHFTDCADSSIMFTYRTNQNKDHTLNFKPTQIFLNNRRTYKEEGSGVLYHARSGHWIITDVIGSSVKKFMVKSTAFKPEFITGTWKRRSRFSISIQATIECGEATFKRECQPHLCKNSGVCHKNSQNGTWCTCPYGFTGTFCETKNTQICPEIPGKLRGGNRELGAIRNIHCPDGTYGTLVCQPEKGDKQSWILNCNTPHGSIRKRREAIPVLNAKNPGIRDAEPAHDYIGVKVLVVIVPVLLLPGLHFIVYYAAKTQRLGFWRLMSMQAYVGE